ncbi:SulP family inorganic anion transporter [Roseateles amylovorans]|uniref:SulP family inorganic anion transporter n=1 Tax=Roseateles amylovorans TaxID=2978473 RepID=A0ABY6B460_9BURK|nr:SulP family inorganic anion transporter [Roseateles amylovorans]UXH78318.1 SulP family inorganic anion transporter [Roseateles amylovorans]
MPVSAAAVRLYVRDALRDDLIAAVVVSVLLIPQSLAYAMLAGLPPQVGLYASLLPPLMYAALGSSPFLNIGPVAVLALMILQTLQLAPAGVSPSEAALVLSAEVGLLLAAAALLRLHALAALLSVPVLHGFETGATLAIAASQLPVLLGSSAGGATLPELWQSAAAHGFDWRGTSAAFGVAALAALILVRRLPKGMASRLAPLVVLLAAIALTWWWDPLGLSRVGTLPPLALSFTPPRLDPALWTALLPGAALIALLGYVSSLAVAESLARRVGQRVDARRELMGLAGANLAAALSGGMPSAASFSRSVLMSDAGSRTRMTGVFVAGLMGLALMTLSPVLAWCPKPVLAASIMVAVLSGLKFGPYRDAWHYDRTEALLMWAVTLLVLGVSITAALGLGVLGAIALLLQRSARPHVALIGRIPGTEHYRNVERYQVLLDPEVLSLRIDESLLFLNGRSLADVVQAHLDSHPQTRRVLLQMSPVNSIDFSGLSALKELHETLARQGRRLDLSEVKGPVLDRLKAGGWTEWFQGRLFLSHHQGMQDHHGQ